MSASIQLFQGSRKKEFDDAMQFIVKPEDPSKGGPPNITMCALCSEDPRFCNEI